MSAKLPAYEIFIVDSAEFPHGDEDDLEREVLKDCGSVHTVRLHNEGEFEPYLQRADAIILWHHTHLTRDTLLRLKKTRIIVRNGVGFDNVDIAAAAGAGIAVANVPDYGTDEVADHAMALILACLRQSKTLDRSVRNGEWDWKRGASVQRLSGLTLGIVGCGRIGTAVVLRAKAFGLRIQFFDPYLPAGYEKAIGVNRCDKLKSLLATSDVVSLHAPLNTETQHLINAASLQSMKPTSFLVNTARGGLVESSAVLDALKRRMIAGAGLDVLEDEPALGSELAELDNCIVTPHSAFYSEQSMEEMRSKSAQIVRYALLESRYLNVVNGVSGQQNRKATEHQNAR